MEWPDKGLKKPTKRDNQLNRENVCTENRQTFRQLQSKARRQKQTEQSRQNQDKWTLLILGQGKFQAQKPGSNNGVKTALERRERTLLTFWQLNNSKILSSDSFGFRPENLIRGESAGNHSRFRERWNGPPCFRKRQFLPVKAAVAVGNKPIMLATSYLLFPRAFSS